ncbi:hypothetical protein C8R46DRAFT_1348112 [Mycena filopes]|nr:hypothetical protein C8R46DRAFT_1348112 [Mycena filopes]
MKSCLKTPSLPGSPDPGHLTPAGCRRKCVVFTGEGSEQVYWADEWDRTPTEPATKLSYQEILELKEIQQSLPHAAQPADLRPGKQLLSTVPIALLPLAAAEEAPSSPPPLSPPPQSPSAYQTPFIMPPGRAPRPAPPTRLASASLTHLRPPAPSPPRVKPAFAFLPLLSPAPAPTPPPVPAPTSSAATTGSYFPPYPPARSADDGEPDRVLPPRPRAIAIPNSNSNKQRQQHPAHGYEAAYRAAEAAAYSPPFGSSAYDYARDRRGMLGDHQRAGQVSVGFDVAGSSGSGGKATAAAAAATGSASANKERKKKKSFMLINDIEVEIEDDEWEEEPPIATPTPATSSGEDAFITFTPADTDTDLPPPRAPSFVPRHRALQLARAHVSDRDWPLSLARAGARELEARLEGVSLGCAGFLYIWAEGGRRRLSGGGGGGRRYL